MNRQNSGLIGTFFLVAAILVGINVMVSNNRDDSNTAVWLIGLMIGAIVFFFLAWRREPASTSTGRSVAEA